MHTRVRAGLDLDVRGACVRRKNPSQLTPCTFSQNRGDIKYIKFEILRIVSPFEDAKFSNVRGLYLRKYGIL